MTASPIAGTNVAATVVPFTTADTFPTHDESYGRGVIALLLPQPRVMRCPPGDEASVCWSLFEDDQIYQLADDLLTWSALPMGGGGGGPSNQTAAATAGAVLAQGDPLAISLADGKLYPADANIAGLARVVGVASANYAAGAPAIAVGMGFTMSDWTAVIGSSSLATAVTYFLAPGGGLTNVAPTTPGQFLVNVGVASSPTTLILFPNAPILL